MTAKFCAWYRDPAAAELGRQLWETGVMVQDMAVRLRTTPESVSAWVRRVGLPPRKSGYVARGGPSKDECPRAGLPDPATLLPAVGTVPAALLAADSPAPPTDDQCAAAGAPPSRHRLLDAEATFRATCCFPIDNPTDGCFAYRTHQCGQPLAEGSRIYCQEHRERTRGRIPIPLARRVDGYA